MRKFILALVALATIASPLAFTAPASAAGTPGCVTRAEYLRIHGGHTVRQVRNITGAWGRQVDRSEYSYSDVRTNDDWETTYEVWMTDVDTWRDYRKCRSWRGWNRTVSINFDNYTHAGPRLRVFSKSA